jgi:hypothetical protein
MAMSSDKRESDDEREPAGEPTARRRLGTILGGLAAGAVLGSAVAVPLAAAGADAAPGDASTAEVAHERSGSAIAEPVTAPRAPTAQEAATRFSEKFRTAFKPEVVSDAPTDDPSIVISGGGCSPAGCSAAPAEPDGEAAQTQ